MEQAKQYRDFIKGDKVRVIKEDEHFIWYVHCTDMFPHKVFKDVFHKLHEEVEE